MNHYAKIFELTAKANVCREVAGELYAMMGKLPDECDAPMRAAAQAKTAEAMKLEARIKKLL